MKALPLAFLFVLTMSSIVVARSADFTGNWSTSFGDMTLKQKNDDVDGSYNMKGFICTIKGRIQGSRLTFHYTEPNVAGKGWFEISEDGQSFNGKWLEDGSSTWRDWMGIKSHLSPVVDDSGYSGLWNTSYGLMRLIKSGNRIEGIYGDNNSLKGALVSGNLEFTYQEPKDFGEGSFTINSEKNILSGKWRPKGASVWGTWTGTRVVPSPNISWLIVIEAPWETNLLQNEYSFGNMLKSFFSRYPLVQVRQRIVNSEEDLKKYLREVAFLPEPSIVTISSHGSPEGIKVGNKLTAASTIVESLKFASEVKLLHFGGCEVFKNTSAEFVTSLRRNVTFPISGYGRTVDWAASAIFEFAYYEFLLARRMTVREAADQSRLLFPFSSGKDISGGAFHGLDFKLLDVSP